MSQNLSSTAFVTGAFKGKSDFIVFLVRKVLLSNEGIHVGKSCA